MTDNPIALVLGGTVPHIELIKQLKARGYHVILIDYLDDSPARRYADEHIQESTLDQKAVLEIAKKRDAKLVISSAIDQANITCCYVAEQLGLPHPYSYETALDVTHKDRMKAIMVDGGVPTAPFVGSDEIGRLAEAGIGYPCIVKPTNSNGSKGVRVVACPEELREFLPLAKEASRTNEAIVESFISGIEISGYFYVQAGISYPLATCQKTNYTQFVKDGVRQYESVVYPADISSTAKRNLIEASNRIAKSFRLNNTPLFVQAIVDESSNVFVLEFAPRLGGGLCFRSIPLLTGFDFIGASICSYLGEEVDLPDVSLSDEPLLIGNMFAKADTFDHVEGVEEAIRTGLISEFHCIKGKGASIGADGSSGSRFGQFIIQDKNVDELFEKEEITRRAIKAFNPSGLLINA